MMNTDDLNKIIENLTKKSDYVNRFYELVKDPKLAQNKDFVKISFSEPVLLEFENIKQFKSSKRKYSEHSENLDIPYKRHYHITGSKGNYEIYAINVDGTAHHKKNKGFIIPTKEADELRSLGVKLKSDNVIETYSLPEASQFLNENNNKNSWYISIIE